MKVLLKVDKHPLLPPQVSKPQYAANNGREPDNRHTNANSCLGRNRKTSAGCVFLVCGGC
jgi:hypothetical protein